MVDRQRYPTEYPTEYPKAVRRTSTTDLMEVAGSPLSSRLGHDAPSDSLAPVAVVTATSSHDKKARTGVPARLRAYHVRRLQGEPSYQEDTFDITRSSDKNYVYASVFDGHGGDQVSSILAYGEAGAEHEALPSLAQWMDTYRRIQNGGRLPTDSASALALFAGYDYVLAQRFADANETNRTVPYRVDTIRDVEWGSGTPHPVMSDSETRFAAPRATGHDGSGSTMAMVVFSRPDASFVVYVCGDSRVMIYSVPLVPEQVSGGPKPSPLPSSTCGCGSDDKGGGGSTVSRTRANPKTTRRGNKKKASSAPNTLPTELELCTEDHKPTKASGEADRIRRCGGHIDWSDGFPRCASRCTSTMFSVSRGFGDLPLKCSFQKGVCRAHGCTDGEEWQSSDLPHYDPRGVMSVEPDVYRVAVRPGRRYIVLLGTDGLFDHVDDAAKDDGHETSDRIPTEWIQHAVRDHSDDPQALARSITSRAVRFAKPFQLHDNLTLMVLVYDVPLSTTSFPKP